LRDRVRPAAGKSGLHRSLRQPILEQKENV
jgi:hypothetical protein